jgi:hypothetical protein
MRHLRMMLLLRSLFAAFLAVLGVVLLATGDTVFGCLAIAFGTTNALLVGVLARRSRTS